MVFESLRSAIADVVGAWDRSKKQASERKASRSWTTSEDEILRKGDRERLLVGQLARQLGRTPVSVRNRLNVLGLMPIAEIRLGPTHYTSRENEPAPAEATEPDPANNQPQDPQPEEIPYDFRSVSTEDEEMDQKIFEALVQQEADRQQLEEEEFESMMEEWEDARDRVAAEAHHSAAGEEEDPS